MNNNLTLEEKVAAAKSGSIQYYTEVCTAFVPLAKSMAARSFLRPVYDDAYSIAILTIAEAVQEYRPESGVPFSAYVYTKVKYAVWNLFKKERQIWQNNCCPATDSEFDDWLTQLPADTSVENEVLMSARRLILQQAVRQLPRLQRLVIEGVFFKGQKSGEVARSLNMSPQAVYGVKRRALHTLGQRQDFQDLW